MHYQTFDCAVRRRVAARECWYSVPRARRPEDLRLHGAGVCASLGLPAVVAYGVIGLELIGGLALVLDVYASWAAISLAIEMLGAVVMVHGHDGPLFTDKGGGWEYPAFWAISLVVLTLLGDGAFALPAGGSRR